MGTDIFVTVLIEKCSDIALRCAFHWQVPKTITQICVSKGALSYPGIMKENTRHLPQIQTKPLCDDQRKWVRKSKMTALGLPQLILLMQKMDYLMKRERHPKQQYWLLVRTKITT